MRDVIEFAGRVFVIILTIVVSLGMIISVAVVAIIWAFGCAICDEPPAWVG